MTVIQNRPASTDATPAPLRVLRVVPDATASAPDRNDVRVELSRPLTDLEREALALLASGAR